MEGERPEGEILAGPEDEGRRLDKVLRSYLADASLSEIYAALRKGLIRVNGAKAKPELRLTEGDSISLRAGLKSGEVRGNAPMRDELEDVADILILATQDLLFINKPRGELSQGSASLEGRVRAALAFRSASSLSFVPGPLHRLDRNTTGILTFPRSAAGARAFSALMRERRLRKRYLALADGEAAEGGEWRDRLTRDEGSRTSAISEAGAEAFASMTPLLVRGGRSLLLVELHTGLTHQIRVQASSRRLPLSGDSKYGGRPFRGGYILHALSLEFPEPPFPDTPRIVYAPLPEDALSRLASVFGEKELLSVLPPPMQAPMQKK